MDWTGYHDGAYGMIFDVACVHGTACLWHAANHSVYVHPLLNAALPCMAVNVGAPRPPFNVQFPLNSSVGYVQTYELEL